MTLTVVPLGVHVLDVLVRPVEAIPEGQGGQLVEQIRATAAGTAGGTALTLAKLGARTRSAGAIGTDPLGDLLVELLQRSGVETDLLLRRDDVQTSASVLPIRPNGERPAFHVIGANATYGADDAPLDVIAAADVLHLGAPEFMGGEQAARILEHARAHGTTTAADVLAGGDPGLLEWIAPAFPHLDVFLPNDEQVLGFSGADDLEAGCRVLLERGVGMVAATTGADGALIVTGEGEPLRVPAFASTSSTPPAAAMRSRPASSSGWAWGGRRARPRCSGTPPRRSCPAAWAPTTATSTSPPPTRSRKPRRRASRVAAWGCSTACSATSG